jgi:hypothetical protein
MFFQVENGTVSLLPDGFVVQQFFRNPLGTENFRMNANDEHLLVILSLA